MVHKDETELVEFFFFDSYFLQLRRALTSMKITNTNTDKRRIKLLLFFTFSWLYKVITSGAYAFSFLNNDTNLLVK